MAFLVRNEYLRVLRIMNMKLEEQLLERSENKCELCGYAAMENELICHRCKGYRFVKLEENDQILFGPDLKFI